MAERIAERIAERTIERAAKEIEEKEKAERKVERSLKKKEKQLRGEKWKVAHPGWKSTPRDEKRERSQEQSPSWVEDWLRQQTENYLRSNARHFDRNGTRLWAMTEEQVIGLCRLIYLAQRHHNDKRGPQLNDNYSRREGSRATRDGDGFYLDKDISPDVKGFAR